MIPENLSLLSVSPSFSAATQRRLKAVFRVEKGDAARAVAASLGVSVRAVYGWRQQYHQHGIAGVVDRRHPGTPSRADQTYGRALRALLEDSDQLPSRGWTASALRDRLQELTGQTLSMKRFYVLLRRLGYAYRAVRVYQGGRLIFASFTWIPARPVRDLRWGLIVICEVKSDQGQKNRLVLREKSETFPYFVRPWTTRRVPLAVVRWPKSYLREGKEIHQQMVSRHSMRWEGSTKEALKEARELSRFLH